MALSDVLPGHDWLFNSGSPGSYTWKCSKCKRSMVNAHRPHPNQRISETGREVLRGHSCEELVVRDVMES